LLQPSLLSRLQFLSRFFDWWGRELRGLLPFKQIGGIAGGRYVVVSVESDGARVFEERASRSRELTSAKDAVARDAEVDAILARHAIKSRSWRIVLRLPFEAVFSRSVTLPVNAVADVSRIMALDLERATPFRRRDVLAAHYPVSDFAAAGKVVLRQLVLKRERLIQAQALLARHGLTADRVDCWNEAGSAGLPIDFLSWDRPDTVGGRSRVNSLLVTSACVLALSAGLVAATRLENASSALDDQVKQARAKLTALETEGKLKLMAQSRGDAVVALKNAEGSRAVLIDKLTVLLPETDYLTGLRIEGQDVELSGFSASTATLVPLMERSKVLSGATLTAPVVFDERAQKERFTLKARIAGSGPAAVDSAGKGG
jgi:general secretion pathway protein L